MTLRGLISISASSRIVLIASVFSAIIAGSLLYTVLNLSSSILYVGIIAAMSFGLTGMIYTGHENDPSPKEDHYPDEEEKTRSCSGLALQGEPKKGKVTFAFSYVDVLASVTLLFCVAIVFMIPSMGTLLVWTDWAMIPVGNYVRVAAAVLLTTFLPGYFSLGILNLSKRLKAVEVLLLSYLLSLFFVATWSMLASAVNLTLDKSGVLLLVLLNALTFIAFSVRRSAMGFSQKTWLTTAKIGGLQHGQKNLYATICTVSAFVFVLAMSYRLFNYPPAIWETDQWFNHGIARLYEKFGNQVFTTRLQPVNTDYPRWFHIYLGSLFAVSGAPTTNTYLLISFTNMFGLLALYLLASSFSKRSGDKIAPIASVLALFSGLGWTYDLWSKSIGFPGSPLTRLYQSSISTYDIFFANTFFGSAHPELTTALQVMGLPALLSLLWLTNRDDLRGLGQYALVAILTSLSSLAHVVEGGMFVAILLFGASVSERISWRVCFAALIGVLLTGALGAIMPDKYYVTLGAYYLTLGLASVSVLVSFVRQKHLINVVSVVSSKDRRPLAIVISVAGMTLWLALFLLWRLSGYSSFNVWWDCPRCVTTVPLYLYPNRFGILGLLSIPAVAFVLLVWRKGTRGVALVCGLAIVALVLGRLWMLPQLYKYTGLEEFRWNKYVALALTIPTALMLWRWLADNVRKRTVRRIFLGGFLLALILFSGLASTVLYSGFTGLAYTTALTWRPDRTNTPEFALLLSHELAPDEMIAIQFIVDNLKTSNAVAIVGGLYWASGGFTFMKLTFLGGLLKNQTFSLNGLYGLKNSTTIYQRLAAAKVTFIYLGLDDQEILSQHTQLYNAIRALNAAFQNDQVTVYSFNP